MITYSDNGHDVIGSVGDQTIPKIVISKIVNRHLIITSLSPLSSPTIFQNDVGNSSIEIITVNETGMIRIFIIVTPSSSENSSSVAF